MSVNIYYKKKPLKNNSSNLIFFVDEKYSVLSLKKILSKNEYSFVSDLIKSRNQKKKIITLDISSKKKVILVSLEKDSKPSDIENLGAKLFEMSLDFKNNQYLIFTETLLSKKSTFAGHFVHGFKLKSYKFDKYKSKKN